MPSFDSSMLHHLQPERDFFSDEAPGFRSHANSGSPPNFSSESAQHEIVEEANYMDEEFNEEEAAFCAAAEAFARKCDVHQLAVNQLVQDLVADDELEASKKTDYVSAAAMDSVAVSNASANGPKEQENSPESKSIKVNAAHTGMENMEVGSVSITKPLVNGTSDLQNPTQDAKHVRKQANKHSVRNQNGKKAYQLDQFSSKKRIYPMKERAQDKTFSKSPSKTQAAKPSKSPNSSSVNKLAADTTKAHTSSISTSKKVLEKDGIQTKVKEFLHTRKPVVGFNDNRQAVRDNQSFLSSEHNGARENPDLGPFLLKLAKQAIACGDKPQKALEYAERATKAYEAAADGKHSLDLLMSLHVLAALHCSLGQYEEAVKVLEHSLNMPTLDIHTQEHALAAFAGYMQLGDTFALLGKGEEALSAYCIGLDVQMGVLGEKDSRVGETCRYLAEAHAQALQFDKAEELCQHALDIHKEQSTPASIEEATDRRLMGLIYNGKGQHEAALEQLVLANMALITNGRDVEVAAVDVSLGDTYVLLGRLDEAVSSYQKALTFLKASKGASHVSVASLYISLAELYLKTGKSREARAYCESALKIFTKQGGGGGGGHLLEEVATGLTEIAIIYEALSEHEHALSFLQKALAILEAAPGQQSAVAGVEAQIGVFHYMHGDYKDARTFFGKAVCKLRASAEKNSPLFGIVLNQMGLSCVQLSEVQAAVEIFEESRSVLEAVCGPHHPDTLSVNSNLAGAYDALGRLDDAIAVLEYTLEAREDVQGCGDMEVEDEKARLAELLKEARRTKARKYC